MEGRSVHDLLLPLVLQAVGTRDGLDLIDGKVYQTPSLSSLCWSFFELLGSLSF